MKEEGRRDLREDEDSDSIERVRTLKGKTAFLLNFIAAIFSLLYIYTSGFGLISTEFHRGAYILCTMILCFMYYPIRKGTTGDKVPWIDWLLCLLVQKLNQFSKRMKHLILQLLMEL